eukprot:gene7549-8352_t
MGYEELCGTVLPVAVLSRLCEAILDAEALKRFLQVCSCYHKIDLILQGPSGTTFLSSTSASTAVELPAHRLWEVLLLSEVFQAEKISRLCRSKLHALLQPHPSSSSNLRLPASALPLGGAGGGIEKKFVLEIEERLTQYFLSNAITPPPPPPSTTVATVGSQVNNRYIDRKTDDEERSIETWTTEEGEEEDPPPRAAAPCSSLSPVTRVTVAVQAPVTTPGLEGGVGENHLTTTLNAISPLTDTSSVVNIDHSGDMLRLAATPLPPVAPSAGKESYQDKQDTTVAEAAQKPALSIEDLELSREVARLRVKEKRIAQELLTSRQQAEAALRENRLASLRLKADILRLGSSLQEQGAGGTTRRAASTSRSSSRGRSVGRRSLSSSHGSNQYDLIEAEAEQIELSRYKAIQRIQEHKRRQQAQEEEAKRKQQEETAQRYQKRDERVQTAHPAMWQDEEEEAIFTRRPFDNKPTYQKLSKRNAQPICKYTITVIRAWGLAEMLGGTHAYVTASSSSCYTAIQRTPTIHDTTQPYFGSTLELEMIVDPSVLSNGERLEDTSNILLLSVFNRNGSLSDDLLGFAEVTFGSLFAAQHPHLVVDYSVNQVISSGVQVVYLVDAHNHTAGCLEISLTRQILLGGHLND